MKAIFQYKCRLCGVVFNASEASVENASIILLSTIKDINMSVHDDQPGWRIPRRTTHACNENIVGGNAAGVADLIGYIIEE